MPGKIPNSEIFKKTSLVHAKNSLIHLSGDLPGENAAKGNVINICVTAKDSQHEKGIVLKKKLAEGGEGSVYTTSLKGFVAKIYKRDKITVERKEKLSRMISKTISCEGVCFPEALILNSQNEFVGYLMREADGFELGKSVFQPRLFLQKFPNWTKRETIDLCITILEKIKYLNERNVILGDINPANILVISPKKVYFVDCDSYQIEGYPCPVGTANFTPPEVQGRDYKTFLRTQEMENFAIATLLFMIMLPGKPPYSAVGGASPEKNILNGEFPYPLTEDTDKTPPGKWGFIWSHLSYKTKEAFFQTFKKGEAHFKPKNRRNAGEWIDVFSAYKNSLNKMIKNDPMAKDIFPTRKKGDNVVEHRKCKSCGKSFPITKNQKDWEERKSAQSGNVVRIEVCDSCKTNKQSSRTGYTGFRSDSNTANRKQQKTTRNAFQNNNKSQSNGTKTACSEKFYLTENGQPVLYRKLQSGYCYRGSKRISWKQYRRAKASSQQSKNSSTKIVGSTSCPTASISSKEKQKSKRVTPIVIIAAIAHIALIVTFVATFYVWASAQPPGKHASSSTSSTSSSSQVETYYSYRQRLDSMDDSQLDKSDILKYGRYPTRNSNSTADAIYWRLLEETDEHATYYSAFVLDALPFNDRRNDSRWENSSIRDWLNSSFISAAFSEDEKQRLLPITEDGDTGSMVSLMSVEQADRAFSKFNGFSALHATPHARSHGAQTEHATYSSSDVKTKDGCAEWWLRNSESNSWAPIVDGLWWRKEGSKEDYFAKKSTTQKCGVVPVIKISKK